MPYDDDACVCIYIYIYAHVNIYTLCTVGNHTYIETLHVWLHARPNIQRMRSQPSDAYSACSNTLSAITHTSHMHSKPSATCHFSQRLKRREALEHALRQHRDLVVAEKPGQTRTHRVRVVWRLPHTCACARSALWRAPSEACSWHSYAFKGVFVCLQYMSMHTSSCKQAYKIVSNKALYTLTHQCTHSCGMCLGMHIYLIT